MGLKFKRCGECTMPEENSQNKLKKRRLILWGILLGIVVVLFIAYVIVVATKPSYTYSRRNGEITYGECVNDFIAPEYWLFEITYSAEITTDVEGPWRAEIIFYPCSENGTLLDGTFDHITVEGQQGEWVPFVVNGYVDLEGYALLEYFDYTVTITPLS